MQLLTSLLESNPFAARLETERAQLQAELRSLVRATEELQSLLVENVWGLSAEAREACGAAARPQKPQKSGARLFGRGR